MKDREYFLLLYRILECRGEEKTHQNQWQQNFVPAWMIFFSLTLLPTPWSERMQDKLPSWSSEHFHIPIPACKNNSDTRAELEIGKGKKTILETSPGTCHSWSHQSLHSFSSHSQCHLLLSTQIHHIIECSHHCMPPQILLSPLTLQVLYGSFCGGT